jgi:hypothetical protein
MSHGLPDPPTEVPADDDIAKLAPRFAEKVADLIAEMQRRGHDPVVVEAFRSDERQAWLYGFGREYDDGRGNVTGAPTGSKSWHRYGLAVDIVSQSKGDSAPRAFWDALRTIAETLRLTSGDDWDRDGIPVEHDADEHRADLPHVQWWTPAMRVTPSDRAWQLLQSGGLSAVWHEVQAD